MAGMAAKRTVAKGIHNLITVLVLNSGRRKPVLGPLVFQNRNAALSRHCLAPASEQQPIAVRQSRRLPGLEYPAKSEASRRLYLRGTSTDRI